LADQLPPIFVAALRAAIKDEQQAPPRKDVIKMLSEVRATGKFDEADPLQVDCSSLSSQIDAAEHPNELANALIAFLRIIDNRDPENTDEVRGATLFAPMALAHRHCAPL
jgi:hypothetical protein